MPATATDWYLLPAGHSIANLLHAALLLIDGTDRWMDAQPFHKPCSAYYAGSVYNV